MTQGVFRFFRKLRVDRNRQIGNRPPQQSLANPLPPQDGMVVEVAGVRHQPRRLRQNARPLRRRQFDRLMGRPFPVDRQTVRGVNEILRLSRQERVAFGVVFAVDEAAMGGQQFVKDIPIARENPLDQLIGVAHQHVGPMVLV